MKNHNARPINNVGDFNSQVDIIIPFYGNYEMVSTLINSLFKLTRSNYYKLILVDDFSPNSNFISTIEMNSKKNADRLKQENRVSTVRNEVQKGYAGACKVGYDIGESPYVCFLNSDCIIQDSNWLKNLGESLLKLKSQNVRVIAPMTNNPVGGDIAQKGDKFSKDANDIIIESNSYLTLPCFMCHRELFSKIGGFLKEYQYGFFEDEEFAARLIKFGYRQAVCRSSFVYHVGQATINNLWRANPQIKVIMEEDNRKKCIEDIISLKK